MAPPNLPPNLPPNNPPPPPLAPNLYRHFRLHAQNFEQMDDRCDLVASKLKMSTGKQYALQEA